MGGDHLAGDREPEPRSAAAGALHEPLQHARAIGIGHTRPVVVDRHDVTVDRHHDVRGRPARGPSVHQGVAHDVGDRELRTLAPRGDPGIRPGDDVDGRVGIATVLVGDSGRGDVEEVEGLEPGRVGELGIGQRAHGGERRRHPLDLLMGRPDRRRARGLVGTLAACDVEVRQRSLQRRAQLVAGRRRERPGRVERPVALHRLVGEPPQVRVQRVGHVVDVGRAVALPHPPRRRIVVAQVRGVAPERRERTRREPTEQPAHPARSDRHEDARERDPPAQVPHLLVEVTERLGELHQRPVAHRRHVRDLDREQTPALTVGRDGDQPGSGERWQGFVGQIPQLDDVAAHHHTRRLDRAAQLRPRQAACDGGEDRRRLGPIVQLLVDTILQDLHELAAEHETGEQRA